MADPNESNGGTIPQLANPTPSWSGAEPSPGQEDQASTTPSDGLAQVLEVLAEKVDPLLKLVTTILESKQKAAESEGRLQTRMAWIAVAVVTLVVVTAAFLTYVEKVDGSTFTFLLGLIVGYVLTFIKESIEPTS